MIATSNQVKRFSVFLNPVIELYAPQIRDVIRCDTTRNGTFFFAPKGPRGTFPVTLFPLQEPTTDDGLANLYAKQVLKPASPYAIAELCRKYGEKIPVPLGSF